MKLFLISILFLFVCGCSTVNEKMGLRDDNLGEEAVEDVIKGRTGAEVDLTPGSPEKN